MMTKERVGNDIELSAWMREAMDEVSRDIKEVESGRPGFMRSYTVDELLKELHT